MDNPPWDPRQELVQKQTTEIYTLKQQMQYMQQQMQYMQQQEELHAAQQNQAHHLCEQHFIESVYWWNQEIPPLTFLEMQYKLGVMAPSHLQVAINNTILQKISEREFAAVLQVPSGEIEEQTSLHLSVNVTEGSEHFGGSASVTSQKRKVADTGTSDVHLNRKLFDDSHPQPAAPSASGQKNQVGAVSNPTKPFAAIVGGSKVSSKIGVIESLLEKVNILILGGGMIFTFYKAQGIAVGSSLVEEDKLDLATSLMEKAKSKGVALMLPSDVVIADKFAADANSKTVPSSSIPDGWMGLDIGPDTIKTFGEALDTSKTIIWNGPMGVFEFDKFAAGTEAIAKKLAELSGKGVTTIIVGGDTVAAVEKVGLAEKMSHISTGGGASLELLEGKVLPGVLALNDA